MRKKQKYYLSFPFLLVFIFFLVTGCNSEIDNSLNLSETIPTESSNIVETIEVPIQSSQEEINSILGNLEVHFIDVGQGDATLIISDDKSLLIDGGSSSTKDSLSIYIEEQGISHLDYVVGTHADADHVGGLHNILTNFPTETILLSELDKNSDNVIDILETMESKHYTNTTPIVGDTYPLGDASFTIVSPNIEYSESDDNSISLLLTHGDNSFLFTGDCQKESENDMLITNQTIQADVYKVGNHGSNSSNSNYFLQKIKPTYAVISCGKENSNGYPNSEPLDLLRDMDVALFRTDEQGSITVISDGENLEWNCTPSNSWKSGIVSIDTPTSDNESSKKNPTAKVSTPNESIVEIPIKEPVIEVPVVEESVVEVPVMETTVVEVPIVETPPVSSATSYLLNTNSNKFHFISCGSGQRTSAKNRSDFSGSREEVIGMGYSPCGNCDP